MSWLKKLEIHTWRNAPACILGAGPSLRLFDFSNISNCHLFSINSSILKTKWDIPGQADLMRVWISNDSLCRKWSYFDKVKSDICFKVVRDSWLKYQDELKDFIFFNPRKTREDIIEESDDGLLYNSSVPSAIDLAIKLGFKEIYLFGIDHITENEKSHFWQFLSLKDQPKERISNGKTNIYLMPTKIMQPVSMQKNVWNMNIDVFKSLNNYANSKNVKIINVNDKKNSIPFEHKKFETTNLKNYGIIRLPISKPASK